MTGLGLQRDGTGSPLGTRTVENNFSKGKIFDFICNLYAHASLVSRQNTSCNQLLIMPHFLEMPKSV